MLSCFSHVQPLATPWTVAHQASLSMEVLQIRILELVAMSSSRESSLPKDRTHVSCGICRQILYHWATGEAPLITHTEHYIHNSPHFSPEGLVPQYLFRPGTLGHYQLRSNLDSIFQICSSISLFMIEYAQYRRIVKFLFHSTMDCTQTYLVITLRSVKQFYN